MYRFGSELSVRVSISFGFMFWNKYVSKFGYIHIFVIVTIRDPRVSGLPSETCSMIGLKTGS